MKNNHMPSYPLSMRNSLRLEPVHTVTTPCPFDAPTRVELDGTITDDTEVYVKVMKPVRFSDHGEISCKHVDLITAYT